VWADLKERVHLEVLGADGRGILKWIFQEIEWGGMGLIDLAQGREKWWAVVKAVMNLQVS
jgi:hypothetical protein